MDTVLSVSDIVAILTFWENNAHSISEVFMLPDDEDVQRQVLPSSIIIEKRFTRIFRDSHFPSNLLSKPTLKALAAYNKHKVGPRLVQRFLHVARHQMCVHFALLDINNCLCDPIIKSVYEHVAKLFNGNRLHLYHTIASMANTPKLYIQQENQETLFDAVCAEYSIMVRRIEGLVFSPDITHVIVYPVLIWSMQDINLSKQDVVARRYNSATYYLMTHRDALILQLVFYVKHGIPPVQLNRPPELLTL